MRLLDTNTGQFVEKDPEKTAYAILSHTWDAEKGEQTYKELKKIQRHYPLELHTSDPESRPRGADGDTAGSSSTRNRGHRPPSPPPALQTPIEFPSETTPLIGPSRPTQSWFTRRISQLKRWCRCRPARNAHQIQTGTRASVLCTPVNALSLDIPPTSSSNNLPVFSSNDPFVATNDLLSNASNVSSAPNREHHSVRPPQSIWDDPGLSLKIRDACAVARKNGYRYIWIDSCCIDKSSSSELSEAINSMYKWYNLADMCYAYLADVPPRERNGDVNVDDFRRSRWFERGWTLQELIAPINVEFLAGDWSPLGSKYTHDGLVESITNISRRALLHLEPLSSFSVAQRISWAAGRSTTRVEDAAYSLLGIFDIHMPTLYGEGNRAFQRLQEQIMHRIPDQSLFAWSDVYMLNQIWLRFYRPKAIRHKPIAPEACRYRRGLSLCAWSPFNFMDSGDIYHSQLPASLQHTIGYTYTPYGIRTQLQMIPLTLELLSTVLRGPLRFDDLKLPGNSNWWYLAILGCEHRKRPGFLLGRICYVSPSESGVEFVYAGHVQLGSRREYAGHPSGLGLFPVSPYTISNLVPHFELKTDFKNKPYNTIKLILLTEARDALHSQGYHADLRNPDPDHPTTHWLILSNDEHTITIEFRHTLKDHGKQFTIDAEVNMSGSCAPPDSASDSGQADRHTVSWEDESDCFSRWNTSKWKTVLGPETVKLTVAGAGAALAVDLSLDFVGSGVYFLRVDVRSDVPPAPTDIDLALPASRAAGSAGEEAREAKMTGDHSSMIDTKDSSGAGREVESGGHEMTSVEGARNLKAAGDVGEGEDRDGSA